MVLTSLFSSSRSVSTAWATMGLRPSKPEVEEAAVPEAVSAASMKISAASAAESKIQLYTPAYYQTCALGGVASCGLTHLAVTPLDVVKCNMQTDSSKYKSIGQSFKLVVQEQGVKGLFRGWLPTLLGYSAQGACKFGFYEYFKK